MEEPLHDGSVVVGRHIISFGPTPEEADVTQTATTTRGQFMPSQVGAICNQPLSQQERMCRAFDGCRLGGRHGVQG
jgi:hypothetical protein